MLLCEVFVMVEVGSDQLDKIRNEVEEYLRREVDKRYKCSVENLKIYSAKLDGLMLYVRGEVTIRSLPRSFTMTINVLHDKLMDVSGL